MYCPDCGDETEENQKFCTKCGAKLTFDIKSNSSKNGLITGIITVLIVIAGIAGFFILDDEVQNDISSKTSEEILKQIDEYQAEYFRIIKRNDMFLVIYDGDYVKKDGDDLAALYKKVEEHIDKNNEYYKSFLKIDDDYAVNPGETTADMNEFAGKHLEEVDKLLNETYQAVKQKIPPEDFKDLIRSELDWLQEIKNYDKRSDAANFGTIGGMVYYRYQVDMRRFRTLLLMLYL